MATNDRQFWRQVNKNGPLWNGSHCWEWTGLLYDNGYGRYGNERAHRIAWKLSGKTLPPRPLMLDHMCRNRRCVNDAHLRPINNRNNQLCGVGFVAENAAKTVCVNGHELSGDNVYEEHVGDFVRRHCERCRRDRGREARAKYHATERKPRPSVEVLSAKLASGASWMELAREYGVSDVAVRKWAKKYGLLP